MATATLPWPAAKKRLRTYDEMVTELPESDPSMEPWDGVMIISPTPIPNHQRIVHRFAKLLEQFVSERKLGEVFLSPLVVVLSHHRVVQPDVFFTSKSRLKMVLDRVRRMPDPAVEVIAEGSWRRDRVDKKDLYEQFGVREHWVVDPDAQTIEVLAPERDSFKLASWDEAGDNVSSKMFFGFAIIWPLLVV